jgi:hypothetical protein
MRAASGIGRRHGLGDSDAFTVEDGRMVRREQYERLERHLRADGRARLEMTFAEVAAVIGVPLPPSAFNHSAWWGTDPKHTQAVWLDAGYQAHPNLTAQRVVFTRSGGIA